jgi:hypothetical protein
MRIVYFIFYTRILFYFTFSPILNYFHIISLCKRGRPFPSCDVEFLNSCFYTAWWWLYKPKPGRQVIYNIAKESVGCDLLLLWGTEIYKLTSDCSLGRKDPQMDRNFPSFKKPEPSLPCFQHPHIVSQRSSVHIFLTYFFTVPFNITLHISRNIQSGIFPSGFSTTTLMHFSDIPFVLPDPPIHKQMCIVCRRL